MKPEAGPPGHGVWGVQDSETLGLRVLDALREKGVKTLADLVFMEFCNG